MLVAVLAAVGILWADALSRFRGTATILVALASLVAAYATSGLELALLKPRRIDELGAGLSHGAEALANVQMPYAGADPWPAVTLQLLGAFLCVLAGLLAFWPRERGRGYQFLALALLLVLVASPVISMGGKQPVALGIGLTALTVCFLWLERLPLRPGLGIAAMLGLALAGALPLASAADKEEPWFDYRAFAEGLGPDEALQFDWGHSYGPMTWPRDGSEVLRVATQRASYWKVADLDDFDGETWVDSQHDRPGTAEPEDDLAEGWEGRPAWRTSLRVTLRRIETYDIIGTGTTLDVTDSGGTVGPSGEPGRWRSDSLLKGGDSYTVKGYAPRPNGQQLSESWSGSDTRQSDDLDLGIPVNSGALPTPIDADDAIGRLRRRAAIRFPPFAPAGSAPVPFASFQTLSRSSDGDRALKRSPYRRTWLLAKRLMRQSDTPYEYVVAVNSYLQEGFRYDETPDPVEPGVATLDGFLFDTKSGYCQHYSGAMALLLRMGGIPARVATGFSPGGYSKRKQAWIVRDTDAHSWVEAWFDDYGWVTFDPTPAGTPARSQIAAIDRPPEESSDRGDAGSDDVGSPARTGGVRPDLPGSQAGPGGAGAAGADGGGPAWWWFALGAALLAALGGWVGLRMHRRNQGPGAALDRAVAELEAALRRIGRPATPGTTLRQIEQRFGRTPEAAAYLQALRAGRYAPTAPAPMPSGRRALRRELGSGSGPRGRLRALWALPPWRA